MAMMNTKLSQCGWFVSIAVALALAWLSGPAAAAPPVDPAPAPAAPREMLRSLPLRFTANSGQTDPAVRFTAESAGQAFFFTDDEVVFTAQSAVARLRFLGANPHPTLAGLEPLPGAVNFFLGNDPARWRTEVQTYGAMAYHDLYPGIDLIYHGADGGLKSEFVVAPEADPSRIAIQYSGADTPQLRSDGALILQTPAGAWVEPAPRIYQDADGGLRREVPGGYRLVGGDRVSFQLGAYDRSKPLILDPALGYITYLGGIGWDQAYGIAVDAAGNAYVTGLTDSFNFPTTANATQPTIKGADVFVTQIMSAGGVYTYGFSTYLGGSGSDWGRSIAVDEASNVYVAGWTESADFPIHDALQSVLRGGADAFVTQLVRAGSAYTLGLSTYLGSDSHAYGVAMGGVAIGGAAMGGDATHDIYVTGDTAALDFPTTPDAAQRTYGGGASDAFLTQIVGVRGVAARGVYTYGYSTYLGGGGDDGGNSIAFDGGGNVFVTGQTTSTNFPTSAKASQPVYGGGPHDAFITYLNLTPHRSQASLGAGCSTYLGGNDDDVGSGIAVDGAGNAYVTGYTDSANFPTRNAVQKTYGGGQYDAFITQLRAGDCAIGYSTFLGGSAWEAGWAVAADGGENAYVTGFTESTDFPIAPSAIQPKLRGEGSRDSFVTKIIRMSGDATQGAHTFGYSTYLGGSDDDQATGIALDSEGTPYVTGFTSSRDFPVTRNALQAAYAGDPKDAFVVRLGPFNVQLKESPFPTPTGSSPRTARN
jgi:hypothetical protein